MTFEELGQAIREELDRTIDVPDDAYDRGYDDALLWVLRHIDGKEGG